MLYRAKKHVYQVWSNQASQLKFSFIKETKFLQIKSSVS